eukprot:1074718-Amphidinium_carterae.1
MVVYHGCHLIKASSISTTKRLSSTQGARSMRRGYEGWQGHVIETWSLGVPLLRAQGVYRRLEAARKSLQQSTVQI